MNGKSCAAQKMTWNPKNRTFSSIIQPIQVTWSKNNFKWLGIELIAYFDFDFCVLRQMIKKKLKWIIVIN